VISRNLVVRIAFALPAIALTLTVIRLGGWVLAAVLALVGVLGVREIFAFARAQGITPFAGLGYVGAGAIPCATVWGLGNGSPAGLYGGALWIMLVLVAALATRSPGARPLAAVAITVFACLYASGLPTFLVAIRHGPGSTLHPEAATALGCFPLAVTWICDTCAMAAGALIGGPKLAPVLSPRKTWAGAVGGVLGGLGSALAYGPLVLERWAVHLGAGELAATGLVVAVAAQLGDAAESLFKREVGVKDSSTLIPGHGGVLDRLDSLYFVLPVSAGLFHLFGVA
jgi:phosphatidate cytidylyltransferase